MASLIRLRFLLVTTKRRRADGNCIMLEPMKPIGVPATWTTMEGVSLYMSYTTRLQSEWSG